MLLKGFREVFLCPSLGGLELLVDIRQVLLEHIAFYNCVLVCSVVCCHEVSLNLFVLLAHGQEGLVRDDLCLLVSSGIISSSSTMSTSWEAGGGGGSGGFSVATGGCRFSVATGSGFCEVATGGMA